MRYLLDTHTLIWYLNKNYDRISNDLLNILLNPRNHIFISIASLWEIAIKQNIGKFKLDLEIKDIYNYIYTSTTTLLSIEEKHLLTYKNLPLIHREPFDRLLISTSIAENLTFVTHDKKIQEYPIDWLWV